MQANERIVLNHLIETCRDAEKGYRSAASLVSHPEMKALFTEAAEQRTRFAAELLPHAQRLGGADAHDGTGAAALHRRWMEIKGAVTHDDHSVVTETSRGDEVTLHAYKDALEGMLPPTVRDLVERHYAEIRSTHERIQSLDRARPRT